MKRRHLTIVINEETGETFTPRFLSDSQVEALGLPIKGNATITTIDGDTDDAA